MTKDQSKRIEAMYLTMFRRLYAVAFAALRDSHIAEEAVQDTFRIACAKPQAVLSSPNPEGWLMNTLKNVLMKIRSRQAYDRAYVIPLLADQASLIGKADERDDDILSLLNEDDRRILTLTALEGKTMNETAKILGISLEACKKRAQRARRRLKEKLIKFEEGEKKYE